MCGIAGYFGSGSQEILAKMTNALRHRGPDDEGFYLDGQVGLGHRRLSIIDLSPAGHQPMSNDGQDIWLVFNGEIYNFRELRQELISQGYKFKSNSDTEVIINLYAAIGVEAFKKLNGMFAAALYDARQDKLILARDRLGKKPLYWGIFGATLIFGSELKALLQHPDCRREINLESLNKYLLYEYVPTPRSIFKGIHKLEPGHYLSYDGRKVVKTKFWEITFKLPITNYQLRIQEVMNELGNKINAAVKARLVSDVPLGIFLSGGIDSSTIAYYAQQNSVKPIKTFSIGFKEDSFDESKYARLAAKHLGAEHYEKILSAKDSLDLIPRIADLLDEPLGDASILPTYLLSEFTKEKVTVALGGDGGDELFCGYDTFPAEKFAAIYEKIPLIIRRQIIERVALNLPVSFKNISFDFKLKKFIAGGGEKNIRRRHASWLGSFSRERRAQLFTPEVWRELQAVNEYEELDAYEANVREQPDWNKLIYAYLRTYLMDDILVKVDRASMGNALEVRAPFLDFSVVDFVNSLPFEFKMKGLITKFILKELMKDKLPIAIVNRQKKGFGIPLAQWLTADLRPLLDELLSEGYLRRQGLFNSVFVSKLVKDHIERRADNRKPLWTLLCFQLWQKRWLK
ncbi:asparagine synthase (glutamine-hydrolyzing) [Candidatus Falkowbacteria bacterium CG10_big_fil_rev_8_21_14_0_10_44_15]|uniref:asparagine synthase (glutamine-hydrolyzing) n=1 Tax=Candidatus Falkowbacteria bacterium CG10_big_fil_rev_8_21_14_0_10_44_15 TaxID=1974569 RepID=A0A2H0V066_9BACT|nr:MAG: asparagine synthase (glutamine-hydrolyzing) [Candidatus Falkowbacteria bacterium CG10_big_fil_rev_8_21_14_0_10_44_15]